MFPSAAWYVWFKFFEIYAIRIYYFFKVYFIYLKGRGNIERGREGMRKNLPSAASPPKWAWQPGLGQVKAGSLDLLPSLPHGQ